MLTIFTPTYNRKEELKKLYNSLVNQTSKDFEWLIVDDGSSDETDKQIKQWIEENIIQIVYIKQVNSGKSKAHNNGTRNAKGNLFICVDSDDYLTNNAVEIILEESNKINEKEELGGLIFLNLNEKTNNIIGNKFPQDYMEEDYYSIYNKLGVTGDKSIVYKTEVLKQYLFPEIKNEKFVPEALVYNRISKKYKLLCINIYIKYVCYLSNGYSNNYFKLCKSNPIAEILYYKELYDFKPSLYNVAAYILYSIYAKCKFLDIVKNHRAKIKVILLFIPTYIKYFQKEKENKEE